MTCGLWQGSPEGGSASGGPTTMAVCAFCTCILQVGGYAILIVSADTHVPGDPTPSLGPGDQYGRHLMTLECLAGFVELA
jgi:hypothetical protein